MSERDKHIENDRKGVVAEGSGNSAPMKRLFYLICIVSLVYGCDNNRTIKTTDKPDQLNQTDTIVIPTLTNDTAFDYKKAQKYQTFDEHKLTGIGKAKSHPFVFVIADKDTVYVRRSDIGITFRYIKKEGYIHNRISFDMEKADATPCKCADYTFATVYDRYIFADSILELRHLYYGDYNSVTDCSTSLFIKDGQSCLAIDIPFMGISIRDIEHPLNEIRQIISVYNSNSPKTSGKRYLLKEDRKNYYYVFSVRTTPPPYTDNRRVLDSIVYQKQPLGIFGLEPGFGEIFKRAAENDH